mgnify:CR=1 FL=1
MAMWCVPHMPGGLLGTAGVRASITLPTSHAADWCRVPPWPPAQGDSLAVLVHGVPPSPSPSSTPQPPYDAASGAPAAAAGGVPPPAAPRAAPAAVPLAVLVFSLRLPWSARLGLPLLGGGGGGGGGSQPLVVQPCHCWLLPPTAFGAPAVAAAAPPPAASAAAARVLVPVEARVELLDGVARGPVAVAYGPEVGEEEEARVAQAEAQVRAAAWEAEEARAVSAVVGRVYGLRWSSASALDLLSRGRAVVRLAF